LVLFDFNFILVVVVVRSSEESLVWRVGTEEFAGQRFEWSFLDIEEARDV
jgi:hypothetical protein